MEAIRNLPVPHNKTCLQEYLGFLTFTVAFYPHCAQVLHPLYLLLKGKNTHWIWTVACQAAFIKSKQALQTLTLLAYHDPSAPTPITVDASNVSVGEVLKQHVHGQWTPTSFFSRKLHDPDTRYSAIDRELLAIYLAIRHFRHFVEGRAFTIFTDHKPLIFALSSANSDKWTPTQTPHLSFISQFTSDIRHINGKDNVVADALSHIHSFSAVTPTLDYTELAAHQTADQETQALRTATTSLKLVDITPPGSRHSILCDTLLGFPRPVVPISLHRRVFDILHSLSHPGSRPTKRLIAARYVQPGFKKDITLWAKCCLAGSSLRSHDMWLVPCRVSLCQVPDSSTFMLTLWDLSHLQEATPICLQSLIDSLAGQKQSRWLTALLKHVPRHSFQVGFVGRGYGSGIAKSPMSQNDSYSTQSKYNIIKTMSDHQ